MNRRYVPFPPYREPHTPSEGETPEAVWTIISTKPTPPNPPERSGDLLPRWRDVWRERRAAQAQAPTVLDADWEEILMRAVRIQKTAVRSEMDIFRRLAAYLPPVTMANAALLLVGLCLLWQMTPATDRTGLQAYTEAAMVTYDEFRR